MSEKRNKGGRPPRAPGEKMTRLSVMLRPIYREALELLAREQRTSISQALENVLAQSLRTRKVDDRPLLEVAQGMVWNSPASLRGRLYRIRHTPFRTPDEQHAYDVLMELKKKFDATELLELFDREPMLAMLFDMVDETYKMGSPANFCANMFAEAVDAERNGQGQYFTYADSFGMAYTYDLDEYFGTKP